MYKNWPEICRTSNPWLRMLVATASDEAILGGLQSGFPSLFSATETELRIPLSSIRQFVAEQEDGLWSRPLEHFSIPNFVWGETSGNIAYEVPLDMRATVASLPKNDHGSYCLLHETGKPVIINWNDQPCLVVEAFDYYPEEGGIGGLTLVPIQFIDLES